MRSERFRQSGAPSGPTEQPNNARRAAPDRVKANSGSRARRPWTFAHGGCRWGARALFGLCRVSSIPASTRTVPYGAIEGGVLKMINAMVLCAVLLLQAFGTEVKMDTERHASGRFE